MKIQTSNRRIGCLSVCKLQLFVPDGKKFLTQQSLLDFRNCLKQANSDESNQLFCSISGEQMILMINIWCVSSASKQEQRLMMILMIKFISIIMRSMIIDYLDEQSVVIINIWCVSRQADKKRGR